MHEDYLPLLSSYQKMESSILSVAHSIYRLPQLSHIWEGKSMATMMDNNHRLTMHYPAFEALDNLVGSLRYLKRIDEVDQVTADRADILHGGYIRLHRDRRCDNSAVMKKTHRWIKAWYCAFHGGTCRAWA